MKNWLPKIVCRSEFLLVGCRTRLGSRLTETVVMGRKTKVTKAMVAMVLLSA